MPGNRTGFTGFTLVEVLVALAIVGLALPALLFYMANVADTTTYLREKTVAQWIASNRYTEALLAKQLKGQVLEGSSMGRLDMANGQWIWQVEGYESESEGIQRLDIRVYRGSEASDEEDVIKQDTPLVELLGLVER